MWSNLVAPNLFIFYCASRRQAIRTVVLTALSLFLFEVISSVNQEKVSSCVALQGFSLQVAVVVADVFSYLLSFFSTIALGGFMFGFEHYVKWVA